jgi:hypothetical protein
MLFKAICNNAQKAVVAFQAFRQDPAFPDDLTKVLPAKLDTVNQPLTFLVTTGGGGTANVLPETVGANGFPVYNIEVLSGTLEEELIGGIIGGDGKPGSGLSHIEDTWELEVVPDAAVGFSGVDVKLAPK